LSSGSLNCLVYTSNLGIGNYTFTASVTPSNEPWATPNTLPSGVVGITYLGDLNGDFQVNFNDVITFVSKYIAYNTNGIYNPAIDYNHDGTINFNDIVLFVSYYTAYHNSAIISVNPATQQFPSAHVGDTIQINITVSNVQNLWAWDITPLTFNPSVLNLTQVTEGPFLKAGAQTLFIWTSRSLVDINEGRIVDTSDNRLEFTTQSGSGEIATLTFKVLSTGSSQISFGKITLDDDTNLGTVTQPYFQQIPVTGVNANIIVGNSS
jgi:hypothetical protein